MSFDPLKVRKGDMVRLKSKRPTGEPEEMPVKGVYLSTDGLVFMLQIAPGSIVCRNVKAEDIEDKVGD